MRQLYRRGMGSQSLLKSGQFQLKLYPASWYIYILRRRNPFSNQVNSNGTDFEIVREEIKKVAIPSQIRSIPTGGMGTWLLGWKNGRNPFSNQVNSNCGLRIRKKIEHLYNPFRKPRCKSRITHLITSFHSILLSSNMLILKQKLFFRVPQIASIQHIL